MASPSAPRLVPLQSRASPINDLLTNHPLLNDVKKRIMGCVHLHLDFTCFFILIWFCPDCEVESVWPQNLSSTAWSFQCSWGVCGKLMIPLCWLAYRSCEPLVSLLCLLCVLLSNCSSYRMFMCKSQRVLPCPTSYFPMPTWRYHGRLTQTQWLTLTQRIAQLCLPSMEPG